MPLSDEHIFFIFPGQGSQYRGMGSDLYQDYPPAKQIYDGASEVLGYDIAELSFQDPHDQLNLTRFTQPALLTHSIACLEVFRELTDNRLTPAGAAGHSLGEYSALVAAGALTFEDALRLVQQRGELMGTYGEGEMTAFPLDLDTVRPLAEQHYCGVGGCNLPDQTVIGGRREDLDLLEQAFAERFPRKRAVRLKTEGAFHTYYMVEAARRFRSILDDTHIAPLQCRVLSNYTGAFHDPDPASIKARLFFQLFNPVLWFRNLQTAVSNGVTGFIEFGGGIGSGAAPADKRPNLESIIRKILRGADHKAFYLAAINSQTLRETAQASP